MISEKYFWFCVYEYGIVKNIMDFEGGNRRVWYDEKTENELEILRKKIKEINYDSINDIVFKLGEISSGQRKGTTLELRRKYRELIKDYDELGKTEFVNDKGFHIIIITSPEMPKIDQPKSLYDFLLNTTIVRSKKQFELDKEMILQIFKEKPELYRQSLFSNLTISPYEKIYIIKDYLKDYVNQKFPIKHRHRQLGGDVQCNESKNGILRGVVHMIGLANIQRKTDEELLGDIFDSGYLEIQYSKFDTNSGIFTLLVGNDDTVDELYNNNHGIYLMLSLSVLDDFDYWVAMTMKGGNRDGYDFYKGICPKCTGKTSVLQDYSAAERGYMGLSGKEKNWSHEMVFTSDINLERYVEKIYVPNKKMLDEFLASDKLKPNVKALLTGVETKDMVYRKNCLAETPPRIKKTTYNKLVKMVKQREEVEDLPKINYKAINIHRTISLTIGKIGDRYFEQFPTFEQD
jgi:hypothetical protein